MSCEDDLWCDWCGKRNLRIHRYDDRAFCGASCIHRYQARGYAPNGVDPTLGEA